MKKLLIGAIMIPIGFFIWGVLTFIIVVWAYWHLPALHDFWIDSWVPLFLCMAIGPLVFWIILPLVKRSNRRAML